VTVSGSFRKQLDSLTETLKATEPHYIKCIKPNALKGASVFSSQLVVQQLRWADKHYELFVIFCCCFPVLVIVSARCPAAQVRPVCPLTLACLAVICMPELQPPPVDHT
jgi:hypothetical protein